MTFKHAIAAVLGLALLWGEKPRAGEITYHRFASEILGRDYHYALYLPDGYHETNQAYPILYLLHGSFGSERDWVESGGIEQAADRMIREGHMPPAVIVMPGSESWWIDGHNEAARSAFLEEFMPNVEETWRVVPQREWRAIAGLSAGGYGTLNFVLERPDLFAAAAALSPASYRPLPPRNSSAWRHPAFLDEAGNFDEALWHRRNYTAHLDAYLEREVIVPLYLSAGDRDVYHAEHHARLVRQALVPHQPDLVVMEVLRGGHTWRVWRASLPSALSWIGRFLQGPVPLETLTEEAAAAEQAALDE
ncbi:esterase family protein [Halomonas sp. MCCC 1A17488]|uniref:Esterase family protein n=1 Tax=Billgrantia sulfidoxydans TaxID=2733484 RepID=A0ABX7WB32_9GAMM|nr:MULTISPECIES: alpha/beta hydrolase-fold protein [Halomonas]MCE8017772.1 esterase family protein [Halomonas sp. MCCC 1A17488]MCG3241105.1 esterase family protein [Halomonas sp. MCCC 1A17488]QPP48962.1 esterase family protein [Halomonas sp. SS10-MC5]QTP56278.1 esterase family protein [Halomonas sulfidoxydans]